MSRLPALLERKFPGWVWVTELALVALAMPLLVMETWIWVSEGIVERPRILGLGGAAAVLDALCAFRLRWAFAARAGLAIFIATMILRHVQRDWNDAFLLLLAFQQAFHAAFCAHTFWWWKQRPVENADPGS